MISLRLFFRVPTPYVLGNKKSKNNYTLLSGGLHLDPYLVYTGSADSGESAHLRRLARVFVAGPIIKCLLFSGEDAHLRNLARVYVARLIIKCLLFSGEDAHLHSLARVFVAGSIIKKVLLFSGEDAIPTGGGVSFNVDFKPVKKSKRRRKIKKRAQTPMVPKVEEKEDVRNFFPLL